MLDDYAQTGEFPKWSEDNGETYVMVGDPADSILADYYAFGAKDFSASTALQDMITEATTTNDVRPGLNYVNGSNALGYLPADGTYGCCNFYGPVSTQLEYDAADYSIASFAKAQGDTSDYTAFASRAQNWQNVFNPASGFMQPKPADGTWLPGFDPASGTDFVEGTSWMYTGMVNFNVAGLAAADGGTAAHNSQYLDKVLSGVLAVECAGMSRVPEAGLTLAPPELALQSSATASTPFTVTAGQHDGAFPVTVALSDGGPAPAPTTLSVDVAKPGELWPYYSNIGVSADGGSSAADYDGDGFSYSATALAADGITPGAGITSDGVSYTWPDVAPGALDNIEATGQTIPLQPTTATKIGLLGSATNAPSTDTTGTLTVTYTDGGDLHIFALGFAS
jgi:Glycosyl hydrolase family 92